MSARYYVLVSDELAQSMTVQPGARFRLVRCHCPEEPGLHWWVCEDDDAPESLNGKRVEPVLGREDDGTVYVIARRPA